MRTSGVHRAVVVSAALVAGLMGGSAQAQLLPGALPTPGAALPSAFPPPARPIGGGRKPVGAPRLPDPGRTVSQDTGGLVLDASGDMTQRANAALRLAGEAAGDVAVVVETPISYRQRARDLLRHHPDVLEPDDQGRPVVRGEVVGLGIAPKAVDRAVDAGFSVRSRETIDGLGLLAITFRPPHGMSAAAAVKRLRRLDPDGRYDFNHVYIESGGGAPTALGGSSTSMPWGRGLRIGLVDGAALASHPALRGATLVQQPFAPDGGMRPTAHGTAVASLLAGSEPGFRGAAPGAAVYVADVYGSSAAGGSALAVARALGWLAKVGTPVVNISLVGPPNALLQAGVAALVAKGHLIVSAVGNDGPAAAPLYPAAYPGVVAVTGVDPRRRPLPEAGRGPYVAFAAPGAGMIAAGLDGGLVGVRGTSFAAPLVAGRLARELPGADPAAARRAVAALSAEAADLGRPGRDPVFGHGLVGVDLAVRPAGLAARR